MGIFDDIGDAFSEMTGFGGKGNPDPHNMDPDAYTHLYNEALGGIEGVGNSGKMPQMRSGIEDSATSMLGDLENNAAGRKANFQEDMARGFQADQTSKARAAGGTGNLASVLHPSGGDYDSQARAQSRGLNDLYGQAVDDLGALGGVQNQLYGQDMSKATAVANLKTGELANKRGIAANNLENTFNSEQAGRERRMNTYNGIAKSGQAVGKMMAMGGSDRAIKHEIQDASHYNVLRPFREAKPYQYKYLSPDQFGEGQQISPMAQDLQAAGLGDCVESIDGVLHINYGKALGRMFSAISALTAEVDNLRKAKG